MVTDGERKVESVGTVEISSDFELDPYECVSWFTSRCSCGWNGERRTSEEYPGYDTRLAAMRAEAKEHMLAAHPSVQTEA